MKLGNPVRAAIQYYADDLPSPQVVDVELACWRRKWLSADQDLPKSAVQALAECDSDFCPNVHKLLRILCTLPITSAECERSFLKHIAQTKDIPAGYNDQRARVRTCSYEHTLQQTN